MLSHLYIKNYALIDEADINFPEGFITITGETGAGKSILLGALGLISGNRADSKVIRSESSKAIVEAVFSRPTGTLKPLFEENGLEWDDEELILRREIAPSGRSRTFANDTPVNLSFIGEIAPSLLDIHAQHNNLLLSDNNHQRRILDTFGDYHSTLTEYHELFKEFSRLHSRLTELKRNALQNRQNRDIYTFQLEQLNILDLKPGEYDTLDKRQRILSESTEIKTRIRTALDSLSEAEDNAVDLVTTAVNSLAGVDLSLYQSEDDSDYPSITERLNVASIELRDIADTLSEYLDDTDGDPHELMRVEERLSEIYHTATKFNCRNPENLISLREELRSKLDAIDGDSPEIKSLEAETKTLADKLRKAADNLTELRKNTAKSFSQKLVETAMPLGLKNLRFEPAISKVKIGPEGQDKIEFLCAFNKNQPLMPMAGIASGGEISRLMLSLKALVAERMQLPTMIFDEVDSGVSGETASRMGDLMKQLASDMQIITVTHLPQVAAKGTAQFHVYKEDTSDSTITHIIPLSEEERVKEIARILSADEVDEAAMQNARSLLTK